MREGEENMNEYDDKLLDHEYDGIRELDNSLPRWWVWLFNVTIVFGVVYMAYYHVLDIGYLSADEYRLEMDPDYLREEAGESWLFGILPEYRSPYYDRASEHAEWLARNKKKSKRVILTAATDTTVYLALTNPASTESGREVFLKNCAACHIPDGGGDIGPNLTDKYWLHGAGMSNVVKTIKYGFPTKGMISWRGILKEDQIMDVASFVLTLQGTTPQKPKAPQGELVEVY